MLFSWTFFLCGVTFWASLRCGKAYGSSKLLLRLNFFLHNSFIVCIGKAFNQRMLLVPLRCELSYGSSMFVLERPLSSAGIGFH